MRFTQEAQVIPSMGRTISMGWGAAGWDVILRGSIPPDASRAPAGNLKTGSSEALGRGTGLGA